MHSHMRTVDEDMIELQQEFSAPRGSARIGHTYMNKPALCFPVAGAHTDYDRHVIRLRQCSYIE